MAQSFRVALVGTQGENSFFTFEYGLQVFDLCADQICQLMEKPNTNLVTELGAVPTAQYSVMGGGRFYPMVSREEIAQAVKGVEMVIITMSTQPHYMSYVTQEFFNYMFTENLAENCQYVVVRITNPEEKQGRGSGRRSRRRSGSQEKVDPERIMNTYGLDREKIKAKIFTITDQAKLSKKKSKKGQTVEDSVRVKIDKLRSELTGEEIKVAFTQPVKETASAGKSLLGLGQRFGSWLGSLIKSQ